MQMFCWSSREGACCTGPQAHLPKKSDTTRAQGYKTWCKQVSQCWDCTEVGLCWGARRKMVPASYFVPREELPCLLLSGKHSQKSEYFPFLHLRHFPDHYFHTVCLQVACLSKAAQCTLGSLPAKPADFQNFKFQQCAVTKVCTGLRGGGGVTT